MNENRLIVAIMNRQSWQYDSVSEFVQDMHVVSRAAHEQVDFEPSTHGVWTYRGYTFPNGWIARMQAGMKGITLLPA